MKPIEALGDGARSYTLVDRYGNPVAEGHNVMYNNVLGRLAGGRAPAYAGDAGTVGFKPGSRDFPVPVYFKAPGAFELRWVPTASLRR